MQKKVYDVSVQLKEAYLNIVTIQLSLEHYLNL